MPPSPPSPPSLDLVRTLVNQLSRSARTVERRTGVTNAQLFVLQQIAARDALSINDLAVQAQTQQSTVSSVVSRLVRDGLVRKAWADEDSRRAVLSLSASGRRLLKDAPAPPTSLIVDALATLTAREARALNIGLRALVRALGPAPVHPSMLFEFASPRSRGRRKRVARPRPA